ncbi:MAG: hypothetical protein JNL34_08135, partial [Anaerolineae bacterium]|nr:hypothetical protein [Anaerolineae bacterium]
VLLKWASEQAGRLDAEGADDAAFDELAGQLRRLVKQINRYAGEGLYTPPDEQASALMAIAERAGSIGLTTAPTFSAQAAPADPMAALAGVLASFAPTEAAPPGPAIDLPETGQSVAATSAPVESAPSAPEPVEPAQPSVTPVFHEDFHDL